MGGNFCSPVDEANRDSLRLSHLSTPALAPAQYPEPDISWSDRLAPAFTGKRNSGSPSPGIGPKFRKSQEKEKKNKKRRSHRNRGNPLMMGGFDSVKEKGKESNTSDHSSSPGDSIPLGGKRKKGKIDEARFLMAKRRGFTDLSVDKEGDWDEDYFFICISDPQIGMWNRVMEEEYSRKCVKIINELQPRFVVCCGDMSHEKDDRKKQEEEVSIFKQIYSKIDDHIPLICVCGNHDVGDLSSSAFSLSRYKDRFGDDYFAFHAGGVKYIVFNSSLYVDPGEAERDSRAQNVWLDGELSSDYDSKHTIAFCHIPPFINEPDEGEGYFNMPEKKRGALLEKLNDADVSHLFCGHYHRNAGGKYKDLEVVVTGAVGTNIINSAVPGSDALDKSGIGEMICDDDTSGLRIVAVKEKKNNAQVVHL